MSLRVKKIIGALSIFAFMLFWIWFAVGLSYYVPKNRLAELGFYAVFGLGWCLPVMPILSWMEYGRKRTPR